MPNVSMVRLYVLRATYLLLVVGLGLTMWPAIIHHSSTMPRMNGVVYCLLGALGALSLLGIRYPLKMLPLLFFELVWKVIWLIFIALPLWRIGQLNVEILESVRDTLPGVIIMLLVIPWPYVISYYVKQPGDRWRWKKDAGKPQSGD